MKQGAHNSGRKRKMSVGLDKITATCLRGNFGLEMTTCIVNHKLGSGNEVSLSTVRRSAKQIFGGKCHNRATKKTGCRDPDSPWCIGRFHMGLQLQQQFRVDTEGASMVGTTVVKLFDGKPFVGTITFYDADEKYYQVTYSDGDQEELEFGQLRVPEWHQLNRRQVLWLDEKHKKVCECIYYVSLL